MKNLKKILHARSNLLKGQELHFSESKPGINFGAENFSAYVSSALLSGKLNSYRDLLEEIDRSKTVLPRYYMRVARLRKKVIDEMALQDYSETMRTEYNKSRYEVQRSLMLAHVLKIKGITGEAISIWEKTFRKARRYSLTMESYICAKHLCYEYAFRRKYRRLYNMSRMSGKLLLALQGEHSASAHYNRLVLMMKGKWYISPSFKPMTSRVSKHISALALRYKTHELYSMHFRARIYYHYAAHDYRALLDACRKYFNYLKNHKHLQQDSRWAEIAIHQMNASISLGNFATGIRLAEDNRKYMRPENPNWFSYLENYFQLLMNAGQYRKAKELYGEVMSSVHRRNMSPQQIDVWKVFLAYVQLALHSSGMISRFKPRQHFSILTTCKSDKAGLNFLIEAGLLMYMLVQANRGDIDKHGERFRKYVKRHIVKSLMPRHHMFAKMMLIFVRHHHRPAEYIRKATFKHFLSLRKLSMSRPHDFEANELIRFEHIWEMLLQQLSLQQVRQAA